jgi:hypothetical protein
VSEPLILPVGDVEGWCDVETGECAVPDADPVADADPQPRRV